MTPERKTKRKQWIMVVVVLAAVVLVIVIGLKVSDPYGQSAKFSQARSAKPPFSLPLDTIHPEQQWLNQGEQRISQLDQRESRLEDMLKNLEVVHQPAPVTPMQASSQALPLVPDAPLATLPLPAVMPSQNRIPKDGDVAVDEPIHAHSVGLSGQKSTLNTPTSIQVDKVQEWEVPTASVPADNHSTQAKSTDWDGQFIPAGSFAKVVLLSGFDVPTGGQASQNALPLVMRVKSFMQLPNSVKANIKECFITGSGYGDLASERAYIRTERLSCVFKDGHVLERKIKGHVLGEDATFGLRGKVISKQGSLIAKSFFSGLFSGIGTSIAQQSQLLQSTPLGSVSTIDPNRSFQAGLGSGMSTSSNKIADFYLQQANQIFPVIEIAADRIAEVFLMEGFSLREESKDAHPQDM